MRLKSELNNTKHYLRESRKALLGRGGEISATAGLRDLPTATIDIPVDVSLAFYEDSSEAYEKSVPVGVKDYALLRKVEGTTFKVTGKNLCSADREYTFNEVEYDYISLGTYKAGSYYISANFNLTGAEDRYLSGANLNAFDISSGLYFDLTYDTEVTLDLTSSYVMNGGEGEKINGTIGNFMICRADEEDKTYEPYFEDIVNVKPTSIESRGKNLYGGIQNIEYYVGMPYSVIFEETIDRTVTFSFELSGEAVSLGGDIFKFTLIDDTIKYATSRISNITLDNIKSIQTINYAQLTGSISNIQLEYGNKQTDFSDFVGTLDTLEIPENAETIENEFLKVQGGGTIIFHNEYEKALPSEIKYIRRTE